jgi:hypothetical protein
MDVHEVAANVQRRRETEAVRNELELRAIKQKDAVFQELRIDLHAELESQVAYLEQQGTKLFVNKTGDETTVNRSDSAKTLTITFSPLFHRVSFNYQGGSAFKRTLTVEAQTVSGLSSREKFFYRRENGTVMQPSALASQVSELLNILLA